MRLNCNCKTKFQDNQLLSPLCLARESMFEIALRYSDPAADVSLQRDQIHH